MLQTNRKNHTSSRTCVSPCVGLSVGSRLEYLRFASSSQSLAIAERSMAASSAQLPRRILKVRVSNGRLRRVNDNPLARPVTPHHHA